jgi:hypothetical protein
VSTREGRFDERKADLHSNNDVLNVGAIFHEQYPKQPVTADQDLKARMTEIFADHNENVRAVMDLAEDVLVCLSSPDQDHG